MENQEQVGVEEDKKIDGDSPQPKKVEVQIACSDQTRDLIQRVLMPGQIDPFNRITMNAAIASGRRKLPVNIVLGGSPENGRMSVVSNALITMITFELVDPEANPARAIAPLCIAEVGYFDKDGKSVGADYPEEAAGTAYLQMTVGNHHIHEVAVAIIKGIAGTFVHTTTYFVEENYFDPDDGKDPGPDTELSEQPAPDMIPFPVKSDVGPEAQADDGK